MKLRWPRGKHNGQRIVGVEVKFVISLTFWALKLGWNFGNPMIHFGPLHFWFQTVYDRG